MTVSAATDRAVAAAGERDIAVSRVFDAPRDLVFQMWTDPKHIVNWWGPKGFTNTIATMDVRPGGVWEFVMHGPDGTDYKNKIIYREVVRPSLLTYSHVSGPLFEAVVQFAEEGSKTRVDMRMVFETPQLRDKVAEEFGAVEGLNQTLDRLAARLAGDARPQLITTRFLDAPRELVFDVWTDPKHLAAWWGPRGFTNPVCEVDARPGGEIRIDMTGPDGAVYPMRGVFTEVVRPERIVMSSRAHGSAGGDASLEVVNSITFEEHNGGTKLTVHAVMVRFDPEMIDSVRGMEEGWSQTLDRLDAHVMQTKSGADEPDFVITRTFDAPRELMWQVWTDSNHLMKWFGPAGATMIACTNDLRPGGTMHYGMRTADGMELWGKWSYREVVPPERLSLVMAFSDPQGGVTRHPFAPDWPLETLSTMSLAEHDGKTTLTLRWRAINATESERQTFRNGHTSMQMGWGGTFAQLAGYLATIR